MKTPLVLQLSVLALILACSPAPSRDAEVEAAITERIEADEVVAIHQFDQIVVNIYGQAPFDMAGDARQALAKRLAHAALRVHADASTVMIGFGRAEPELQQFAYTWENNDGSLSLVARP